MLMRFQLHSSAVKKLLLSPQVLYGIGIVCKRIADKAGPGMEPSVIYGRNRVHGSVITATREARLNERRFRSLTAAISAGFGDIGRF